MALSRSAAAVALLGLWLAAVAPSGATSACPTNPQSLCSFYFKGYSSTLYSFQVSSTSADQAFSPTIQFAGDSSLSFSVSSTGPPKFFGNVPSGTSGNGYNSRFNDFFYMSGSKLARRSYNQVKYGEAAGRCVLLLINLIGVFRYLIRKKAP